MLFRRVRKPKPPPEVFKLDYATPPRPRPGPDRWERIVGMSVRGCVGQLAWQVLLPALVLTLLFILRYKGCVPL